MNLSRRNFIQAGAVAAGMPAAAQTSANDRVQVGVVGCGARSQELITALLDLPQFEIVAIADAYKGRIERTMDRVGKTAKPYRDHREIMALPSVDAVVIVTPDHWHKTMVLDSMRAKKDVYCEKPLTYRSPEGVEIIEAAKSTGRIVQVGSQGMSSVTQKKAKEMIKAGKLGKITMIRAAFNRNTASGAWIYPIPPDASPQTVDWDMFQGPAPKHNFDLARFFRWRCYNDYSGGIATDLFVHLCTTINYLMDAKMPSKVVAMGQLYRWKESRDVPDTLNAVLEYPEGFAVNLSSTFNNQLAAESSFQFLGTEGSLLLGGGLQYVPDNAVEDNRWIVESWPKRLEEQYYRDPKVRQSELPATWKAGVVEGGQSFNAQGPDPTVLHFSHWYDSIRTRKPYWQDAVAGHHAASCAHMVNQSARDGSLVQWDFARDDIKQA